MLDYTQALQGGVLIGVACWILLAGIGRVAGVSGIAAGVITTRRQPSMWRWAFLFGLAGGGALFSWLLGARLDLPTHVLMLVPAGFLVGFGTVLGSGCTSGHGVCGLGRRSHRSLVAVIVFMGAAMVTVLVLALLPPRAWWFSVIEDTAVWLFGR